MIDQIQTETAPSVADKGKLKVPAARYLRQWELVDKVREYNPAVDETLLNKAYVFSVKAHGEQLRHSGDPYYAHPIEVAGILTQLKLDTASICTALLHDVLEDTDTTYDELAKMFTPEIAELVQGVTKLGQVELSGQVSKQAENFQKFVLAMSKDLRVLLVKLCDRLHNMRTLQYHPKASSRERIARETMEIYAPLARRIGVDSICAELEDLSFLHLNPSAYESITKRLDAWRESQSNVISQTSVALRDVIDEQGLKARIYGREKRPYAIWRKLERQGISFEDVADIYAFRIILDTPGQCYETLGAIHTHFRSVPGRFRDFISTPKSNGYQSLQTTILGPDNRRVEVQIRTHNMDEIAERGVAAHWSYKDKQYSFDEESALRSGSNMMGRIRNLVEMIGHGDADEFLEHAKLDLFTDQVFTFTPKGDLISLPRGATPIDFAYAVHTDVGDTCIGAIINQKEKPLRTPLENGDVVKIVRGGAAEPQPGWENIVVTGRARSALRRLTRETESDEFRRIGRLLADHAFAREDRDFSDSAILDALPRLEYNSPTEAFEALGRGELTVKDFMQAVFPGRDEQRLVDQYATRDLISDNTARLYVKGDGLREGVSLHLAPCCSPINGDRIMGVQSDGRGVMIHTIDCETLADFEDQPERWIDLGWRRAADHTASIGRISATVEHVPGALADVTKIVGEVGGNLTNIKTLKRSPTFFDMVLDVEVLDTKHFAHIVAALRTSSYVVSARRLRANQL
ncbi:RelA/SpoT family protein [Robiginitomaculum antarcticum]|uniref:RelA/SpoT family protein n=1 Tax=Robiginitomaculum antarcticum TaxID=437507 RepID=UPI000378C6D5|nr:bifunctional (p)ppGpp synthetase/guanosine-3',5'-bis(diphosphate) 3'-pyrophosphohydrolase [Robiginitomaculum antarcticum]